MIRLNDRDAAKLLRILLLADTIVAGTPPVTREQRVELLDLLGWAITRIGPAIPYDLRGPVDHARARWPLLPQFDPASPLRAPPPPPAPDAEKIVETVLLAAGLSWTEREDIVQGLEIDRAAAVEAVAGLLAPAMETAS